MLAFLYRYYGNYLVRCLFFLIVESTRGQQVPKLIMTALLLRTPTCGTFPVQEA